MRGVRNITVCPSCLEEIYRPSDAVVICGLRVHDRQYCRDKVPEIKKELETSSSGHQRRK
ncbi:MAG: hypothetical protein G01um101430_546 [Parcubacteria group bacterium Gr01-1014_30]|nr:MAG: hypothetical protein G01um101430_546 [Parcubacteria group bacterium Gr01-1014_30]